MNKTVLITGILGGIGCEIAKEFHKKRYKVIGLDNQDFNNHSRYCDKYFKIDLNEFCNDNHYYNSIKAIFDKEISSLDVLINNAATQMLGSLNEIKLVDWNLTLNVNLTSPFLLSQMFLDRLVTANGSIINIASIHQQLTKRRFITYATSKSALVGLTKSMSVDLQGKIRVNCISPAAVDTQMLREGFNNDNIKIQKLNELHPLQRIGKTIEIARLALLLAEDGLRFINGANIQIDGGISNVLKDLD